ncbi:MAG: hypothetical protein IPL28_07135 [Chloroflexi bacterium]|nr:hypothetical protein [Chloroflexota bacterium]
MSKSWPRCCRNSILGRRWGVGSEEAAALQALLANGGRLPVATFAANLGMYA